MMGLIARFLPGIGPALGALANPWVLLGALAAAVGIFLWGLHLGEAQLEAFQAKVEAAGQVHEAWRAQRIKDQKAITIRRDTRHAKAIEDDKKRSADAITGLERMLDTGAARRIVPAVPGAAAGGNGLEPAGRLCFAADQLNAGVGAALQRFVRRLGAGSTALLQRGDVARINFETCAGWALDQYQLNGSEPDKH